MKVDRTVPPCRAQQRDQSLAFAKRVAADEVRPIREQRDTGQELGDLVVRWRMTEHRQPECRLRYEHIAAHRLEATAGWVRHALVVAADDGPAAGVLHHHL